MNNTVTLMNYREGVTLKIWSNRGGFTLHLVKRSFNYKKVLNTVRLGCPGLTETQLADQFVAYCIETDLLTPDETHLLL